MLRTLVDIESIKDRIPDIEERIENDEIPCFYVWEKDLNGDVIEDGCMYHIKRFYGCKSAPESCNECGSCQEQDDNYG